MPAALYDNQRSLTNEFIFILHMLIICVVGFALYVLLMAQCSSSHMSLLLRQQDYLYCLFAKAIMHLIVTTKQSFNGCSDQINVLFYHHGLVSLLCVLCVWISDLECIYSHSHISDF